jgi:hypothetical protein
VAKPGAPVQDDLASSVGRMAMVWGPGVLVILLTEPLGGWARTLGSVAGLSWLGALCLWNTARCRRVHCLFTGPFFLVMAGVSLLTGLGLVSLGPNTWNDLSAVTLVGAIVLYFVPERIWGRYWRPSDRPN